MSQITSQDIRLIDTQPAVRYDFNCLKVSQISCIFALDL